MKFTKVLMLASVMMGSAAWTAGVSADGQAVYNSGCMACHMSGAAGAPKLGDKEAWVARIAQGIEVVYEHAIQGFQGQTGVMPAKGGFVHLSDDYIKAAVDYMVSQSQ